MAKGQPEARTLDEKEERKRKKALKKAKRQDQADGGETPSVTAVDEANGKPKKVKKTKKRKSEGSAEESGANPLMEATNGVSEVKPKKRKKDHNRDKEEVNQVEGKKPKAKREEPGEFREASDGKKGSKKTKERKKLAASAEEGKDINHHQPSARAPPPTLHHEGNASSSATNVSVEGMAITPLEDFASAKMPAEVMTYVTKRGWTQPTPIQSHCWPVLNAGRDVVGIAETGSGKTIAFSLPALSRIFKAKSKGASGKKRGPFMLVLAPTRELALQSAEVVAEAGSHCDIRSTCIYGGVPKRDQKIALGGGRDGGGKKSVEVVVATPGRLKDLIGEGACDLSQVTSLVLDEADRMLDLGFEQDVREIIGYCAPPPKRQTAMFSATWPKSIRDLAAEFLNKPVKVTVGADDLTANHRVEQHVEVMEERERDGRLLRLLGTCHSAKKNRVLIFALYKKEAARLEQFLQRNKYDAVAVHGDKGQADRERALSQFKSKARPLMVATDVAARGLDIPDVEYVINYSFPLTIEDYIHRIGRTGRAGKKGVSHTFFHQGDKARAGELANVLQDANQTVPEALTKFGTHVKKKEHKLYGAFSKDVDMDKKSTKITFDDSDDE